MALLGTVIVETANAPGTGDALLLGPLPGFVAFPVGQIFYFIADAVQREWGAGTVVAGSPNRLTRDTVIGNTAGTTARLNFAGAVTVYNEAPAERSLIAAGDNLSVPLAGRVLTGLGSGLAAGDAPRLDQVGWRTLATQNVSSPVGGIVFALPPAFVHFRIEMQDLQCATSAGVYFRSSIDGGATYLSGATDYSGVTLIARPSSMSSPGGTGSFFGLGSADASAPVSGHIEFRTVGGRQVIGALTSLQSGALTLACVAGYVATSGVIDHILIGFVAANATGGRIRLLGDF